MIADAATPPDCSVLIISFNTLELTRECLRNVYGESAGLTTEIIVVDNASRDGSADMIAAEFPDVILLRSMVNLGFGNANNLAMERATGRYWLLLNTDAFFHAGSLRLALEHMEATPQCGVGGGMQVGRDGTPQHASHAFHSVWNDASVLSGLAHKFPRSRWFAQLDRTHTDLSRPAEVDWITGAFLILRPQAIAHVGSFDPTFFLYYEEVDLCRRARAAGWQVCYWPDVVVTHLGGESSRTVKTQEFSAGAAQVTLWRMRSTFLYYRKHHGHSALVQKWMETALYTAGLWRNRLSRSQLRQSRAREFQTLLRLLRQAWEQTHGGRISPTQPW